MAKKTGDSVYKIVEVIGTSPTSWEEAGRRAIQAASKTLRDLRIAEVVKQDMAIENGKVVAYRTRPAATVFTLPGSGFALVRAVGLGAVCVKMQGVFADREASLPGDPALALLDLRVEELLDPAALQAHQVIVVLALVQLEHRLARLEVVPRQYAGLLELREHPVDGGQPDVQPFVHEQAIDVLGGHVPHAAGFEQFEYAKARGRRLESDSLEVGHVA